MPFTKGHKQYSGIEKGWFIKGEPSKNQNQKGKHHSTSTEFKKGQPKSEKWYESMKSRVPWNKGMVGKYRLKPKSDEVKKKISVGNLGKIRSEEAKLKLRKYTGELSSRWKGGVTPINDLIRKSAECREWKIKVFKRDNFTCQKCFKKGYKVFIEAHHIKPFADYPELRFEVDNGITLCVECHKETDNYGGKNRKRKKIKD